MAQLTAITFSCAVLPSRTELQWISVASAKNPGRTVMAYCLLRNARMVPCFLMRTVIGVLLVAAFGCASESSSDDVHRSVDAASQTIRAATRSNAAVASKLADALADQPGNLFYSPLSIEAVSGILFAGANGNTAAQLGMLLDAQDDPSELHEGLGALLNDLSQQHAQYTLSIANRLWTQTEPSQAFVETTRDRYNAPIEHVDFNSDPEAARTKINGWVSEQTQRKIPDMLREGQVTRDTLLAVANAVYFRANWERAFDPSLTRNDTFHRADSTDVSVKMMTANTSTRMSKDGAALWIELPYRAGDVSFLAYTKAPTPGTPTYSVQELQADLKDVVLDDVVAGLQEAVMVLQMPRFSMRSRIDLVPVFKRLGVTDLFDSKLAKLENVGASVGVYVDPFVHEAAVWIDEQGTTAAAATAGGAQLVSSPPVLRLDRPFIFFIRDNVTGAILFVGRVADPTSGAAD